MGTAPGPLAGVRVVEFTWVAAGPAAMMLLALLGADVIRIESPNHPDYARFVDNPSRDSDLAPVYQALNLTKRNVTLDLKDPRGKKLAKQLALTADVVVESMRPGVMKSLGIHYDDLKQQRPDLVMASLSGFGQVGPEARYASYAPIFGATSGISHMTGYPDGIPTQMRASADMRGGFALLAPILSALRRAKIEGVGSYIDVAAAEASSCMLGDLIVDVQMNDRDSSRAGNDHPLMAPHGVYECDEDGVWLTIACRNDDEWRGLCTVLPELDRPQYAEARSRWLHRHELDAELRPIVRTRDRAGLKGELQAAGVAAVESMRNKDVYEDPHAHERGLWVRVDHPRQGERWAIGVPWSSSRTGRGVTARRAPLMHEHTREILVGELGVGENEWQDLLTRGIVCEPRAPDEPTAG